MSLGRRDDARDHRFLSNEAARTFSAERTVKSPLSTKETMPTEEGTIPYNINYQVAKNQQNLVNTKLPPRYEGYQPREIQQRTSSYQPSRHTLQQAPEFIFNNTIAHIKGSDRYDSKPLELDYSKDASYFEYSSALIQDRSGERKKIETEASSLIANERGNSFERELQSMALQRHAEPVRDYLLESRLLKNHGGKPSEPFLRSKDELPQKYLESLRTSAELIQEPTAF